MPVILPIQGRFDKSIPDDFGNCEYRQERELLISINDIITASGLERLVIKHFLSVAYANKQISVFGTDKPPVLTSEDRFNIHTNAIMALRMSILRKRLGLSLRKFSLALSHSDLYKWFCGINRFSITKVPGKSHVGKLENSIAPELTQKLEQLLCQVSQAEESEIFHEPFDFGQIYFDCTCISANIHHPVDWVLLKDATITLMKATVRIRKVGLCHRMPYEPSVFITKMNKLSMEMTFAKRKKDSKKTRKRIFRKMKKLVKCVCNHAKNHLELLESKWKTTNLSFSKTQQIIKQIANVTGKLNAAIKNAHERIIGERKVANKDKFFSLYDDNVNIVVRRKAGAEVEFGNTLYLAEQSNGIILDWKFFRDQAPADCKMLKESNNRIKDRLGIEVELMAGDRGFDSESNRKHMENNDIFNAVCPRNPRLLTERLKENKFRKAQTRRSQTEARVAILSNCFCGSPMKQKGFNNRHIHMGLSIMSHNLWVLGRLKIAQEKAQQQAA